MICGQIIISEPIKDGENPGVTARDESGNKAQR
jgi:hypothetical protein